MIIKKVFILYLTFLLLYGIINQNTTVTDGGAALMTTEERRKKLYEMLQKEKRGLDAGGRHKGGFKPISEEEKLIRAMASSRSRGIF